VHVRNAPLSNLSCQHPADPVPPNPNRLVANGDRALGQQVPAIAERQRLFAYIITSRPITSGELSAFMRVEAFGAYQRLGTRNQRTSHVYRCRIKICGPHG
jgi:hypothetical protein